MHEFIPIINIGPKQCLKWFTPEIYHQIKCMRSEPKIILLNTILSKLKLLYKTCTALITFEENLVRDHANGNSGKYLSISRI